FNGYTVNFAASTGELAIDLLDHDFADKNSDAPVTKIVAEIWNSDEVKFSGTSRCVECAAMDSLDSWSDSAVNFFRSGSLGTQFGKARLSTQANGACDIVKYIEETNEYVVINPSEERAFMASVSAGSAAGTGTRSATITYELTSEPEEAGK
ncbi:MAG TPA: hypothetical protein DEQ73_05805, partial [Phycisphaerales bacterium]|nr:hypothetical protein [Phycisphaerales bacterium]